MTRNFRGMSDTSSEPADAPVQSTVKTAIAFGRIEEFAGDRVSGWLYAPTRTVTPVLLVDGRMAELVHWPLARQDVGQALGATSGTGWEFRVSGAKPGANYELYALYDGFLHRVAERTSDRPVAERAFWRQLERAAEISARPDSVAVTAWDGAHNPIGRAKVLYDVVTHGRPAALFTYTMGDFGDELWPPLANTDIPVVVIPWNDRSRYHTAIAQAGIRFETVWICKPRLPNFHLASVIAANDAKLVLDLDDNDDHFSRSKASRSKAYGGAGLSLSKMYESRIEARTVASLTLQRDYGGEIVRHVREPKAVARQLGTSENAMRIGFIGTVRPHKNILGAARAIAASTWTLGMSFEFHVYGDVAPASLVTEIEATGATVGGMVPAADLDRMLMDLDIVLTGFPSADTGGDHANEYQITSKIGDALALGKPVLVPASPSVQDLADTPAVFLFDESNFYERLREAALYAGPVALPQQFTPEAAYEAFQRAESVAEKMPRASHVFSDLIATRGAPAKDPGKRTLLLLWKQHDSGLYGRRVDQIARAYKRANPGHSVRVLELLHDVEMKGYSERAEDYLSEAAHIVALAHAKQRGGCVDGDGVIRDQLAFRADAQVADSLFAYLVGEGIMPWNSVVVMFPHNRFYPLFRDVIDPYEKIVDVVDNHFSWAGNNSRSQAAVAVQYNELALSGSRFVFNSTRNRDYFVMNGIVSDKTVVDIIPNWYDLPRASGPDESVGMAMDGRFDVLYSGNMNDRVDWEAVRAIALLDPEIRIHLVGGAERAPRGFRDVLELENVLYHGPQSESYSLELLSRSHLAVMPHRSDSVSEFMNPLKLYMYSAAGVPVVASAVEGIEYSLPGLTVAATVRDFADHVRSAFTEWARDGRAPVARRPHVRGGGVRNDYVLLLEGAFKALGGLGGLKELGSRRTPGELPNDYAALLGGAFKELGGTGAPAGA